MRNSVHLSLAFAGILLILIVVVAIVIYKNLKQRVADSNKTLPSLSEVRNAGLAHKTTEKVTNTTDSKHMTEDMMSISDDYDVDSYIKDNKETSLAEDLGDILETPTEKVAKQIKEHIKPVKLPNMKNSNLEEAPLESKKIDEKKDVVDD